MKTQQALLSAVMMCPFLSTATPLGPISLPAPILFCDGQRDQRLSITKTWKKKKHSFFSLKKSGHLELAVGGEDANPPVVIVGHDDVTVHVHCDPCGTLQLPRWTTSDPKPHLKLTVVWKHLKKKKKKREAVYPGRPTTAHHSIPRRRTWHWPVCTDCCCLPPQSVHCWMRRCLGC